MGLDGTVGTSGTEIDAGSVSLLAGIVKTVEFCLNGCWSYCFARKPNVVNQRYLAIVPVPFRVQVCKK